MTRLLCNIKCVFPLTDKKKICFVACNFRNKFNLIAYLSLPFAFSALINRAFQSMSVRFTATKQILTQNIRHWHWFLFFPCFFFEIVFEMRSECKDWKEPNRSSDLNCSGCRFASSTWLFFFSRNAQSITPSEVFQKRLTHYVLNLITYA